MRRPNGVNRDLAGPTVPEQTSTAEPSLGQWITHGKTSSHAICGYDKQPPVTLAGKIHLVIRQEIISGAF